MADLTIKLGRADASRNNLIPFYVVVKQAGAVILQAWSTTQPPNSGFPNNLAVLAANFNNTLETTVDIYNLGKKTNNIRVTFLHFYEGVNGVPGPNSNDVPAGSKTTTVFTCPSSSNFFGTYITVLNDESSQVDSGVSYRLDTTNIQSYKSSDASFVSFSTANIASNPNYIAPVGMSAPIVSATSILNTDGLIISGMQAGDIMRFFYNGARADGNTLIVSSTGQLGFGNMSSYVGTVYFNYSRGDVISPNSQTVTITANTNYLPSLFALNTLGLPRNYVGESANITGFNTGATIVISYTDTASAQTVPVIGTHYNITNITGGYKITYLVVGTFYFQQAKTGSVTSTMINQVIEATRPALDPPIPSTFAVDIGGGVTISNQSTVNYSNINVYKNNLLVIPTDGDYSLAIGVYTFLRAATYTLVGQKADIADSLPCRGIIVVSTVTIPTPILILVSSNSFSCGNLNNGSLVTKTIEVWKNGVAQTPLITTQGTGYLFDNTSADKFKIRFKAANKDYSAFSNELDLRAISSTPLITSWDGTLSTSDISNFIGTGTAGSTIAVYKNDNINALTTLSVGSTGAWTYQAISSGHYKFNQLTLNKTLSFFTANYTVSEIQPPANPSATPIITTISPVVAGSTVSGTCGTTGTLGVWRGTFDLGSFPIYSVAVTDGTWSWISKINDDGDYFFAFKEPTKDYSVPTAPVFSVVRQSSANPVITNSTPLGLPSSLSGVAPNNSTVKIYRNNTLIDSFLIETTAIHLNGVWTWLIKSSGTYYITVVEFNKAASAKSAITQVVENCGELHIRTPTTDQTLFPNTITEEIDNGGIKIGILPETTRTDILQYLVVVSFKSTALGTIDTVVEILNTTIQYPKKGEYLYFTIPKTKCPPINSNITIFIKAVDSALQSANPCISSVDYTIISSPVSKSITCYNIISIDSVLNENKLKLTLSK